MGELRGAGLVASAGGRGVQLAQPYRILLRGVRALAQVSLFEKPSPETLARYLETHFSHEESRWLLGHSYYEGRRSVVERVGAKEWLLGFLEAPDPARWELERSRPFPRAFCLADPAVAPALRALLQRLLDGAGGPLPIGELARAFPELPRPLFARALFAGVRYLLLFPALRGRDLEPVVGLWPPLVRRLLAPPAPEPAAVEPEETLAPPFVADLVAVLAACAAEPLRVRAQDLAIFARARAQMAALLAPLPAWAGQALDAPLDVRVDRAARWLTRLGFAEVDVGVEAQLCLAATNAGRSWLEGTAKERLLSLLDGLRETIGRGRWESPDRPHFVPEDWSGYAEIPEAEEAAAVIAAFADLPPGVFFVLEDFLGHRRERRNPLLQPGRLKHREYGPQPTGEQLERIWSDRLQRFLAERLIWVGGVRLGLANGRLAFAVNDVGRYLLGTAKGFEADDGPAADVVVQPNFEVVFLSPSVTAEAALSRLAERRGTGLGTLFRITRRAVLAAAASGLTGEEALATLDRIASRGVPDNVRREIAGWFAQTRRVALRPAVLLCCPDAETAGRVLAAGGKRVAPLTETVVELREPEAIGGLARKLREMGIFASEREAPLTPAPAGGPPRRGGRRRRSPR